MACTYRAGCSKITTTTGVSCPALSRTSRTTKKEMAGLGGSARKGKLEGGREKRGKRMKVYGTESMHLAQKKGSGPFGHFFSNSSREEAAEHVPRIHVPPFAVSISNPSSRHRIPRLGTRSIDHRERPRTVRNFLHAGTPALETFGFIPTLEQ